MRAPVTAPAAGLETLERRKLMLACMLARRPKVLLLDEPASGLTGAEIDEIDIIVRAASQEHGVAIVIVEHRLELLALVASRVIVLDVGKIIAEGPPETVFDEPKVRAAYFETVTGGIAGVTLLEIKGLSAGYGPLRVLHDLDMTRRVGRARRPDRPERPRQVDPAAGDRRPHRVAVRLDPAGRHTRSAAAACTAPAARRRRSSAAGVALAPQGDAIFPGLTVRQNLDSGAFSARAWRERRKRREGILEIFPPLAKLLDQSVGTLSGGERRMVSLGRAFMGDPRIFLVDEPSLGLAPIISRAVIEALGKIDIGDGAMIIAEQDLGLIHGPRRPHARHARRRAEAGHRRRAHGRPRRAAAPPSPPMIEL